MRDATPAFQPDRGDGGFQLAGDRGFQTQTPVWAGALGLVAGLDSPSRFAHQDATTGALGLVVALDAQVEYAPAALPEREYVGDLAVVVGLTAKTTGPLRPDVPGGGRGIYMLPLRWVVEGDLAVVVALASPTRFTRRPAPRQLPRRRRYAVAGALAPAGASSWAARTWALDYVRDVVVPDDEEALQLLLGGGQWVPDEDEEAVALLLGGRE